MISFTLDTKDLDKQLDNLSNQDLKSIHFGMGEIIDDHVVSKIDQMGLVDKGAFRNSVKHDEYDESHVLIYSNLHYAPHLEYGTRPHKITPKTKKALYWKGAKHPVKSVMHPGTQEYMPFRKGLKSSEREVLDFVKKEVFRRAK